MARNYIDSQQLTWSDLAPIRRVKLLADVSTGNGSVVLKAGEIVRVRVVSLADDAIHVYDSKNRDRFVVASLRELRIGTA